MFFRQVWSRLQLMAGAKSGKQTPASMNSELAADDLTGTHYIATLARLHAELQPSSYLEIGSRKGESAAVARCHSIVIDPDLSKLRNIMDGKPSLAAYQMTSDAFFRRHATDLPKRPLDLVFLDGMHLFEYLLRDFYNVERFCSAASIVAMHDCIPTDVEMAGRDNAATKRTLDRHRDWWAGDVWKMVPILKRFRPDLSIFALDAAPTGLVIVTNLDPASRVLRQNEDIICAEWKEVALREYGLQRFLRECGAVPVDRFMSGTFPTSYHWLAATQKHGRVDPRRGFRAEICALSRCQPPTRRELSS